MGGKSQEPAGDITQRTEPPAWMVPYLESGAQQMQTLSQTPRTMYPGPLRAPTAGTVYAGLGMGQHLGGSQPYLPAAGTQLMRTVTGGYEPDVAPDLIERGAGTIPTMLERGAIARPTFEAAPGPIDLTGQLSSVIDEQTGRVLGDMDRRAAAAGRAGSGLAARAAAQGAADTAGRLTLQAMPVQQQLNLARQGQLAGQSLQAAQAENVAEQARINAVNQARLSRSGAEQARVNAINQARLQAAGLQSQAMNAERQRQLAAVGLAPRLEAERWAPVDRLINLGRIEESVAQQPIDEAIARYHFGVEEPRQRAQEYLSSLTGFSPMAGQMTSQPYFQNQGANILGGALGGAQLAGTLGAGLGGAGLAGPWGLALGAGLGALGGIL